MSAGETLWTAAPAELTDARLRRLGEGIGKVVYASDHWVVKRERTAREILALIVVWKFLRKTERILPGLISRRLLERPSRQIRALRVLAQGLLSIAPRGLWFSTHLREVWKTYRKRDLRGERLARTHLAGTSLIPERVTFPPTKVRVPGWPGWLIVSEATERVECTLHQRLQQLAREGSFDELERWLGRLLETRKSGWQHGLFSTDAHLKNFGVTRDHLVLLDPGGLTNRWKEVEERLAFEDVITQPHIQLGLGSALALRPDIAARFNARWKATVNRKEVQRHWPDEAAY